MKLKQIPGDFLVKEVMGIKLKAKGDFAVFVMKKKRYTTTNAIARIASALKKDAKDFNNAGMKDKDAITEQYVSALGVKKEELQTLKLNDIKVFFKGYSDEKIRLASHTANEFEITARALEKPLTEVKYFCNYYDEQRFGGVRPNMAKIGELLVTRKWEDALKAYLLYPFDTETEEHRMFREEMEKKWGRLNASMCPRYLTEWIVVAHLARDPHDYLGAIKTLPKQISTLFIHAYQSKLFNEMLAEYINKNAKETFDVSYCFGRLPMCTEEIKLRLPLAGYDFKMEDADERIKPIVKEALKNMEVSRFSFAEMPFLSSRTVFREASAEVKCLNMGKTEPDELNKGKLKQKVSFTLDKGCFATMALKAMA